MARRAISPQRRFAILKAHGFRCCYCGRGPQQGIYLQVEHVQAVARGGGDDRHNLVAACNECNAGKGVSDAYEPTFVEHLMDALMEVHTLIEFGRVDEAAAKAYDAIKSGVEPQPNPDCVEVFSNPVLRRAYEGCEADG